MSSIEQQVKMQYSKFFEFKDWKLFKKTAEYYLRKAVFLSTNDIEQNHNALLLRNIQKRLFIGIGCELLLKAFFLKNNCCINRVKDKSENMKYFPFKLAALDHTRFHENDTFTMNELIDNLHKVLDLNKKEEIRRGFKIAKVFRNKEGHVVTSKHEFDRQNYIDIENGLISFYKEAFNKKLKIKFELGRDDRGVFKVS